jgi:hypothetical protein
VISGFCHKVDGHFVLGYYAASSGNPEEHSSQIVNPWLLNYIYRNLRNSFYLCSVLQSLEDSFHIISDSEEEALETQSNNNARAQRTVSISLCWKLLQVNGEF